MSKEDTYWMECTQVKKDTGKALLCVTKEHGEVWVPHSQIHDDSETYKEGTSGTLGVTEWFAKKEGWI